MMIKQFLTLVLCCILLINCSCKEDKKVIKQTEITFKKEGELTINKFDSTKINLDIEIADTDFDTETGLMYRNAMKKNQAMLFVFNDVKERYFYMKNTKIPLDIIFIDDKMTIVNIHKNAKPFDESLLPSKSPVKFVLEINAGLVDAWSIVEGNTMTFSAVSKPHPRSTIGKVVNYELETITGD